jgi:hypothetical protein
MMVTGKMMQGRQMAATLWMRKAGWILVGALGTSIAWASATPVAVNHDDPAWVLSGSLGLARAPATLPVTVALSTGAIPITLAGEARLEGGTAWSLSLARQFEGHVFDEGRRRHPMRLELEGLSATIERPSLGIGVAQVQPRDELQLRGVFLNGLVRVANSERTHWWIGAGIGRAGTSVPDASSALPGCGCLKAGSGDDWTWRVKARGEWATGDRTALFLEAAYSPWPAVSTGQVTGPTTSYGKFGLKNLLLGWRMLF